jgi:hypothetical protein
MQTGRAMHDRLGSSASKIVRTVPFRSPPYSGHL